jgi:hypothetical protein
MPKSGRKEWIGDEQAMLTGILAQIIPGTTDGRVPSAASPRVFAYLAQQIALSDEFAAVFSLGLQRAIQLAESTGGSVNALSQQQFLVITAQLEQIEPVFFQGLLRQTYMGYYSDPLVRPLFGLSARPTQPNGYDVPIETPAALAALVEPVKRRGNCFREC